MESQDSSIKGQKEQLVAAGCHHVIVEHGRSAFKANVKRPGWETLLDMIRTGKVTGVMLCNLSRASRRGEDTELLRLCQDMKVSVKFLDGTPGDISDPSAKLTTGVLSVVNEVSSMYKQIAIRNGLKRSQEAGRYTIPRIPYGYRLHEGWPAPDPEQWDSARQMWELAKQYEFNVYKLSREHPELPRIGTSLYNWMRKPMLRGIVNDEPGKVQALITHEEYEKCERLLASRIRNHGRAPRRIRLFSGLITCEKCGKSMNMTTKGGRVKIRCYRLECEWCNRGLGEEKVRAQIIETLKGTVDEMVKAAQAKEIDFAYKVTAEELETQRDLDQLLMMQSRGMEGLGSTISSLRRKLLSFRPVPAADWAGWADLIRQDGFLEGMTDRELRTIISELVEEIVYVGDRIKVKITLRDSA